MSVLIGATQVTTFGQEANMAAADYCCPEPVTIHGYDDHAMEPFLSRDGRFLFFNNSNAPGVNTNLHYARRLSRDEFQYLGVLTGSVSTALDAVASMDSSGTFYFTTTRSFPQDHSSIYSGHFDGKSLQDVRPADRRLFDSTPGRIIMDAEVSADGETLYYARAQFVPGQSVPSASSIYVAKLVDGEFVELPDAAELTKTVNSDLLEYAPSTSDDELALYFTRLDLRGPSVQIMVATRASTDDPFGEPVPVAAANHGFVEAVTVAADGATLYYHKKVGSIHRIFRIIRPEE